MLMPPPQRLLLIKFRHHGDVLLMTPVIHALKHRYPDAEIDVLVYHETAPMLAHHPDIARLWTLNRQLKGLRKLGHYLKLYRQLAARKYDWALHLSDQWNGALLCKLLHPKEAVGLDYPKRRTSAHWRKCFTRLAAVAPSNSLHAVEQNLATLHALGLEVPAAVKRCQMGISADNRAEIRQRLDKLGIHGDYLVVHPPARWLFKCWEDERFSQVIQALADEGWPVLVTGGTAEQDLKMVAHILSQVHSPRVYSLAGQLSLNTLAALIDGARLFIGVDSVPMHMAAALETDCVALFGPSKVNEWHPWMSRHSLLHAADYGELIDPDAINTHTDQRYLDQIPVAAVLNAVEQLLGPESFSSRRP